MSDEAEKPMGMTPIDQEVIMRAVQISRTGEKELKIDFGEGRALIMPFSEALKLASTILTAVNKFDRK